MTTTIVKLTPDTAQEAVSAALSVLERGGVIAYPTETFYALGAFYDRTSALERIIALKHRPHEKAMPLIIGRPDHLPLLTTRISAAAAALMACFWPGPLTLLFPARTDLPGLIVSGGTVAARMPGESFALRLAQASPLPLTATSANVSGQPPASSAAMVRAAFGDRLDLIVDGSETKGVLPSTIVDASGTAIAIVRAGAVPPDAVHECLSRPAR
ncbi:MAG: L-threonylcarbamoyladenylate synthase [Nitrospirota bacterium]